MGERAKNRIRNLSSEAKEAETPIVDYHAFKYLLYLSTTSHQVAALTSAGNLTAEPRDKRKTLGILSVYDRVLFLFF